jgi:hypothetical protein
MGSTTRDGTPISTETFATPACNGKRAIADIAAGAVSTLLHTKTKANVTYIFCGGWVIAVLAIIGAAWSGVPDPALTVMLQATGELGKVAMVAAGTYFALNTILSAKNGNGVK